MANHLKRLVFIDETWLKTNMIKTTGWAPIGERLVDHAPFGHWNTQTFIAALRKDRLDAPWIIPGAINRASFDVHVETQLAPTPRRGDVVILDNLSSHKSPRATGILHDTSAWFRFRGKPSTGLFSSPSNLPPYSPDLNPVEMALARLKALIRKAAARNHDDLWRAVGHVCNLFPAQECSNFFEAAGYGAN